VGVHDHDHDHLMLQVTEQVRAETLEDEIVLVHAGWDLRDADPEANEHRLLGNFSTREEALAAAGSEPVRVFVLDAEPDEDGHYPHDVGHREA
jgi:hypothetical protein